MICSSCGTHNEAGRKFCGECGARLSVPCPRCGAANTPGVKFCGECGAGLAEASAAGSATAAGERPGGAMPGGPAAAAERRLVTVLFADLVGFTPFAEERDAEEVRDTLTRYFDDSRAVIERYGGTVEKFIGDAVMAVWGAPTAQEDDAERAVRAGLDLVESVRALGPSIQARVGILTGEAAVTIGATDQGLVAGDLVNTAARLQAVAPPGTVLVGGSTRNAAAAAIEFEAAGEQVLKGKSTPVPAHRAVRLLGQRGGQGRSELPEPPFVGREEELRLLKEMVALSGREPKTRLVSITGPAGIGKSRLGWELEKYLDGVVETLYWHRGRSPSYGEGVTFWALGEIVRRRMGLAEEDDEAATRERVHAGVLEWIDDPDDQRWVEPALLTLLGVEPAPVGGRDVLFAAWRIFLERIAARGTTILVFEDLQWADSGLLDFIDHMLEWAKGLPILIITLARPELFDRRPTWGAGQRNFTAVDLEPLSADDMRSLLTGFVPGLPGAAVEAIVARADGIPLYAVETVRALLAEGRLERTDNGYRPVGLLGDLAVPNTLRSLIASRLDALDAADRALLQDASVLGQTFTAEALAAVSGDPPDLAERLRDLVRRQLLEVEADPRSPERGQYGFVQSLIREVAYGTLAKRQRRAKHLAAARRYEAAGDEELAGALASHYLAAYEASADGPEKDAVATQARLALRGAADRAVQLGAPAQALAYLRQALDVTSVPADRAPLLERAAYAARVATQTDVALGMAEEALTDYRALGDLAGLARVGVIQGEALIDAQDPGRAVAQLTSVLGELGQHDEPGRAALLTTMARAHYRNNEPQAAIETADRALVLAERHRLERLLADGFNNKGSGYLYVGRAREAAALMEAAIRIAAAGGFVDAEIRARTNLGAIIWGDETPRVFEMNKATLDLARRLGNGALANWILASQASTAFPLGREWDEVLNDIDEAIAAGASPADEQHMRGFASFIIAARLDGLDAHIERQRVLTEELAAPVVASDLLALLGLASLFRGAPLDAIDPLLESAKDSPLPAFQLIWAGRAAVWARDAVLLQDIIARVEALEGHSALERDELAGFKAGLAGIEGRSEESLAGYRAAIASRVAAGTECVAAVLALDMLVSLGPGNREAVATAERFRPLFERLRARAFLNRLDEGLQRPSASRSAAKDAAAEDAAAVR